MKLLVDRFNSNFFETLGRLFINGVQKCYTLEDEYRAVKVKGETRIPAGTYKVGLRYSTHFSPRYHHDMLWIKDVPGFEFILIHPGNSEADTDGCLLVGKIFEQKNERLTIHRSKEAYGVIYQIISEAIKKEEEVTIEYRDSDIFA